MSSFLDLFNRSPRPPTRVINSDECQSTTKGNGIFKLFLIVMMLVYWRFAVVVERIDLAEQFAMNYPLLAQIPFALTIREMLSLQVLRHLIPVIVGWWLAYEAAVSVVQHLYDLPDASSGRRFLSRLQSSSGGANSTPLIINPDTLIDDRGKSVLLRVGGPGKIKLPATYVGVTEMNDRFCRILPPGTSTLHAFEYLHSVLDLRQQDRFKQIVSLTSRDGLTFRASINIVYRLKTGAPPTQQKPYPYDPEAVRTAAYTQTVVDNEGSVQSWEGAPLGMAMGILNGIVRQYSLDEIFFPKRKEDALFEVIQNEFRRKLLNGLANIGLEMLEAHVVNLELPEEIKDLYVEYWQSVSETDIKLRRVEGDASKVEKWEAARADAEETMIDAILEGINKAQQSGVTTNVSEVVALRLVEALESMAINAPYGAVQTDKYLPALEQIRSDLYDALRKKGKEDKYSS